MTDERRTTKYERGGVTPRTLNKAGRRRVTPVYIHGGFPSTIGDEAKNFMLFHAPPGGADIYQVYMTGNTTIPHAANEADTHIFTLINSTDGATLNSADASLSGVTLAPTGWKALNPDQNTEMGAGEGLQLQMTISGSPPTFGALGLMVEWEPAFAE
jgi:hypothetical protein